jgi:hypothetical protein
MVDVTDSLSETTKSHSRSDMPSCFFAAILFHSIALDGTVDHRSLHGSCPVIKGEAARH